MDNHLSYILELNDVREKFFCDIKADKEVAAVLDEMFDNIKKLTLLHHTIEKLKNSMVNSIDLYLINNKNIYRTKTKNLLKLMTNYLNSFDEYKFYKNKSSEGLSEKFCEWLRLFEKELETSKKEVFSNLKFAKINFQRGL